MKPAQSAQAGGIDILIPGRRPMRIVHAVFDFNGTLALDGVLLAGAALRLRGLAKRIPVSVVTADTFGTARAALRALPVSLHTIGAGREKAAFIARWRGRGVVAVGNGNNDVAMLRAATLGIVILGREGLSPAALGAAAIVVPDVRAAIDVLLKSKRLSATLRR